MSDLNQKVSPPLTGLAMREKYWSELTDTEKVERMRIAFRELPQLIDALSGQIDSLRTRFEEHDHNNGKVLIPAQRAYLNFRDNNEVFVNRGKRHASDPECYI